MATIKPIEGRTVHQIQSGQVIVDLCSVVKELVENSLDAGATSVEVRFKNQGLEAIEVQDNGDGISPNNYDTLALKHHTSKLSTYADLAALQTFGFRGEALSSLCALSRFSVITCLAKDAPKGTKLEFEVSGKLRGTSVVAAQSGTTVSVEDLFNNLPVRRRELERNIKREWGRVVGVLGQYACIQTGIKFSVTQQSGKGKRATIFSTKGNQTTRENIVNVFGAKTLTALVPLDLNLELEPTSGPSQRRSAQGNGETKRIRITGHISRPAFGEGRQTPDRQMFFVNARPCSLPQVAKAFNEVYKSYNTSQSPFIFANIELDTHMYDVNVSPDKRTILLHDQTRMLENLKTVLTELFESQDYTVPISQLPSHKQNSYTQLTISHASTIPVKAPRTQDGVSNEEDSDDGSKFSGRASSIDVDGQETPDDPSFRGKRISKRSPNRDSRAVSLISNWLGNRTEDRADSLAQQQAPKRVHDNPANLSREKRRLVERLGKDPERSKSPDPDMLDSSVEMTRSSSVPDFGQVPLADYNRLSSQSRQPANGDEEQREDSHTPPIPAIQSPAKLSSTVSNIFSGSPRARVTPAAIATITIGDHTVTSGIGAPCSRRLQPDDATPHDSRQPKDSALPLPSFGSSLSQRFAAPGTVYHSAVSEDSDEESIPSLPYPQIRVDASAAALPSSPMVPKVEETGSSPLNFEPDEIEEPLDEEEKRAREEAKVQQMIQLAEGSAAQPSQDNALRTRGLLKGGTKRKETTVGLIRYLNTNISEISEQIQHLDDYLRIFDKLNAVGMEDEALDSETAEEKLSLTISKSDFAQMKIIGQFNLGFILASRSSAIRTDDGPRTADELFIIDQHASDEKYNFERLQATTVVQSQRLVYPKTLDLTAMEEEVVIENLVALETNGFVVNVDQSGESPIGQRCQLISLPLSRETAFSLTDLEELIALLSESPPGNVPRPSKVRKMFAMRACRSSIMIGRTLTHKQMGRVVRNLGELDKPWNCPHGRPTMRHLSGLGIWDELGWKEYENHEDEHESTTNWAAYVKGHGADDESESQ